MKHTAVHAALAAILSFPLALACGQEDPETDDAVASDDYYPLVDGATWTYRHSSSGGWDEVVTMEADPDDASVFLLEDTANPDGEKSISRLQLTDAGVMRLSREAFLVAPNSEDLIFSVEYDPGFLRFDSAWLDAEEGDRETRSYVRTETDVGEDPDAPADREHFYTVESLSDTVVTDAGTFRNCVRIRRRRNWQLPDTTAADAQEKLFYYAPGVGKVKEENLTQGNTEELIDYAIP